MFDGWCASQSVEPLQLPWDRFLNLVYFFATRNATKEKKQEFDSAMQRAVSVATMQELALTRKNALSVPESPDQPLTAPVATPELKPNHNAKLPPRPAGWGDDESNVRSSFAAARSLKVGSKIQL